MGHCSRATAVWNSFASSRQVRLIEMQKSCSHVSLYQHNSSFVTCLLFRPIPPRRNVTFTLKVDHCKGVNFLEHVQARISLTTQRRGDIVIFLTSPSGTRTNLLTERYAERNCWALAIKWKYLFPSNRIHDISRSGFNDWPFMSVHQWGESPQGVWELEIHNKGRYMGKWLGWLKTLFTLKS